MAVAAVSNQDGLHEALVDRARDLVPVLRERAAIPRPDPDPAARDA